MLNFLYGATPAEFKSAFGLDESVARLKAATKRPAFRMLANEAATGRVSNSRVRLQRVIPMVRNSFKPFFFGHFETRGDGVYLTGRFTMLGFVKVFMTLWLGIVLTLGIAFAVAAINTRGPNPLLILAPLCMFGFGIALIAFGKRLARNDVAWLSNVIGTALASPMSGTIGTSIRQG